MDIEFRTNKMKAEFSSERELNRNRGPKQAKKIKLRVTQLLAADTLQDMKGQPGDCHEYSADKDGWISLDLDGQNRLIFVPDHEPKPELKDGSLDWSGVTAVKILGVMDPHERKNKKPV